MEEIKIAPAKFWVIAAYKPGNGGFIKYWKCTPTRKSMKWPIP